MGEVFAGFGALEGLLAAQTQLLQLLGGGRFRGAQQDVGELIFLATAAGGLGGQIVVDLAVGNDQLAVDFALAQANGHHLATDFLAELGVLHAVLFQRCTELLRRHLVAGSNAPDGLFELVIVDTHAGVAGILQLDTLHDEPFEHLALENVLRRQWRSLPLQLFQRGSKAGPQFNVGDDLVADNGHDAVGLEGLHRRGENGLGQKAAEAGDQDKQVTNKFGHGVHGEVSRLLSGSSLILP